MSIDKYDIAKMVVMRNEGLTCDEVAAKFYITPQLVSLHTKGQCVNLRKNETVKLKKIEEDKIKKEEMKKINEEIKRQKIKEQKEKLAYNQNALELEKQFYAEWMPGVFR